jgi:hypothetical protein
MMMISLPVRIRCGITCAENGSELAMLIQGGSGIPLAVPGRKIKPPGNLVKTTEVIAQVSVARGLCKNTVELIIQDAQALEIASQGSGLALRHQFVELIELGFCQALAG